MNADRSAGRSADGSGRPIISASDLAVHFPVGGGLLGARAVVQAVEGVSLDIPRGSFFGLVGEVGFRQDDARPRAAQGRADHARPRRLSGRRGPLRPGGNRQGRAQGLSQARAADLPGPLCRAQPAHDRARHHRRATGGDGHHPDARRHRPARARDRRQMPAEPRAPAPFPARLLGRPAPAHLHRPRTCRQPALRRRRRGGRRARRLDPGGRAEPAQGAQARPRPDDPVHQPRPQRRRRISATTSP